MIDAIIILLSILLRAVGLGASSIWYDEAYSLALSKLPVLEIARLQAIDFNPPLWEILIAPITPVFGLLGARIIALLLIAASMWILRRMLVELDIQSGLRALILISAGLLPGLTWTAQDARPYALLIFLFLLAVLFVSWQRWLGATACMGLMIYTHTEAPFLILGVFAVAVFLWGALPGTPRMLIRSALVILICNLTWPYILLHSGGFWLGRLDVITMLYAIGGAAYAWLPNESAAIFSGILLSALAVLLLGRTISSIRNYDDIPLSIFGLMFMVPFGTMLIFSLTIKNVIFYRPLIPLVLPMVAWLWIASRKDILEIVLVATPLLFAPFLGTIEFDGSIRGGHIDQAAEYITANWQAGDQIYYSDGAIALPFDTYLHNRPHHLLAFEGSGAGLGNSISMRAFGLPGESFVDTGTRTWLIWHREDALLGEDGMRTLTGFARDGMRVMTLKSPQFAPVEIYLIPFEKAER